MSGPLYDPNNSRPGKIQKTTNDVTSEKKIVERPRKYTITVAIPASVVDGAPTLEMKTILAGQVCIHIYNVYQKTKVLRNNSTFPLIILDCSKFSDI